LHFSSKASVRSPIFGSDCRSSAFRLMVMPWSSVFRAWTAAMMAAFFYGVISVEIRLSLLMGVTGSGTAPSQNTFGASHAKSGISQVNGCGICQMREAARMPQ
jgi:hypothetical protein